MRGGRWRLGAWDCRGGGSEGGDRVQGPGMPGALGGDDRKPGHQAPGARVGASSLTSLVSR